MYERAFLNFKSELDRALALERAYQPFDNSQESSERLKAIVGVLLKRHGLDVEYEDIFDALAPPPTQDRPCPTFSYTSS